jgi:2'-5' RNA ligase
MASIEHYSVWIKPEGEVYNTLQRWIEELAEKFKGPSFEPHLTLLGNIQMPAEFAESTCQALAEQVEPFEVRLQGFGKDKDFFHSLFLQAENSPDLLEANSRAQILFHLEYQPDYYPHLSLLYGDFPDEMKEDIILQKGSEPSFLFQADSLYLVRTEGPPRQWEEVARFPLQKG